MSRDKKNRNAAFLEYNAFFERDGNFKYPGILEHAERGFDCTCSEFEHPHSRTHMEPLYSKRQKDLLNGNYFVDPYRNHDTPFYKRFFDEQGYLTDGAKEFLEEFVQWYGIKPMCDAVQMLVADKFARNTKNNYSTIYLWRN